MIMYTRRKKNYWTGLHVCCSNILWWLSYDGADKRRRSLHLGRGDERLGIGETPDVMEPTLVVALRQKQADIVHICASEEHSIAVASTGAVFAWGMGKYGKLGLSKGSNDTDGDGVVQFATRRTL